MPIFVGIIIIISRSKERRRLQFPEKYHGLVRQAVQECVPEAIEIEEE